MAAADYAPTSQPAGRGGIIADVEPATPAERAGLAAGDEILSVDELAVADLIDWQWATDGDSHELLVRRSAGGEKHLTLARDHGERWGVDFTDALFDGVRTCRNDCAFCFMTQLPKGMRRALYLRDDDFRLSFLQGNFITLTNLSDADVERIAEQHLSPLYVSLHAVSTEVREQLVCAREDRALERFDELLDSGIDLHVQIVLVPGVNDGEELDRTLTWLAEREGVASVGVVPLGFTAHQDRFTASYNDPMDAAKVISQVQRWQFESRARDEVTWVHLADEFYLNARAPFPETAWYDGFPQYENGIGLVRSFADEAAILRDRMLAAAAALPECDSVTVVTGLLGATTLVGALSACEAAGRVRLLAVPNRFFGGNVTVTGLLVGEDLATAIRRDAEAQGAERGIYLLPDVVMNADGVTLDDMTLDDLLDRTGADVRLVSSDAAGLLAGLEDAAEHPACTGKE